MSLHVAFTPSAADDKRPWQIVEYEILCKMANAGKTDVEIGNILLRSRQSVMNARKRLGIASQSGPTLRPWTEKEMFQLERLYRAGKSDPQIALELGRTDEAVTSKRKQLGYVPGPGAATPVRRFLTAEDLLRARPCAIDADYMERAKANAAYLISCLRAGHQPGAGA